MIKRATWFVSGAVTGAAGASYAKRKVKQTAEKLTPSHVAHSMAESVRARMHHVADAVQEGKDAMRAKERELRSELQRRIHKDADADADEVTVVADDVTISTGQVIILDDARVNDANRSSRRLRRRA